MMRTAMNGDVELLRLRAQVFYTMGDIGESYLSFVNLVYSIGSTCICYLLMIHGKLHFVIPPVGSSCQASKQYE